MKQANDFFQSSLDQEWDLTGSQSSGWPTFLRNVHKNNKLSKFSICNSLMMRFSCTQVKQTPIFLTHQGGFQHTEEATAMSQYGDPES